MLNFKDGFDYLTLANMGLKWDTATGGGLITGAYGKGKGVQNVSATKTLGANISEGYVCFHFFYATVAACTIHRWDDSGTAQATLQTDATGALFFTRGTGTTIGSVGLPATRLVANTLYFFVARVKIDPTGGIAELKVNGSFVLNSGVTNLNTRNTANSFFNQVRIVAASNNSWHDSYHVWDTAGGDNFSGYIAETIIDTKLANGAGSNAAWTPNSGTNFSRVNEANEDGDTSYNASATPNQIDSFPFANLDETSGAILDVAINSIDRIDDATPRTFDHFVKSSSTTALSAPISPSGSYVNHQTFWPNDPNTSTAWTVTTRNAAEFGYKEIS